MGQPFLLQGVVLEVAHQGIHLGHAVADRSACRKNNTAPSGDLIEVAAFSKHIGGFLRFRCAQSGHISHFWVEEQILERMAFVHKQPVYTQLLKGNDIIFLVSGKVSPRLK